MSLTKTPFLYLCDHPDQNYEKIDFAMKKGFSELQKSNVDASFIIKDTFLSARNVDIIQRWLILDVFNKTGIRIPYQKLEHVMEVIINTYESYAQNLPFNLKEQIYELNQKVIQHLSPVVVAEIYARGRFLHDIQNPRYIDNPVFVGAKGQRTLPSTFQHY